jgi:hypothetical protein
MTTITRRTPVHFEVRPVDSIQRDDWTVVLEYENEGQGPHLVDLSHRPRWDLQDATLGRFTPVGVTVPEAPGQCTWQTGVMVNRMNRTQAAIWHLAGEAVELPAESAYTDVTEATVFLALFGPDLFAVCEKLTALDLGRPDREVPSLIQGPFAHVPCQIVVAANVEPKAGILLTCSRGYGHDMVHAIKAAGEQYHLRPAGERRFQAWLKDCLQG